MGSFLWLPCFIFSLAVTRLWAYFSPSRNLFPYLYLIATFILCIPQSTRHYLSLFWGEISQTWFVWCVLDKLLTQFSPFSPQICARRRVSPASPPVSWQGINNDKNWETERHSHKLRKPEQEQELLLIKHEINIKLYFILIIIVDNIPAIANLMWGRAQDSHNYNVLFRIPITKFSIDKTVFSE